MEAGIVLPACYYFLLTKPWGEGGRLAGSTPPYLLRPCLLAGASPLANVAWLPRRRRKLLSCVCSGAKWRRPAVKCSHCGWVSMLLQHFGHQRTCVKLSFLMKKVVWSRIKRPSQWESLFFHPDQGWDTTRAVPIGYWNQISIRYQPKNDYWLYWTSSKISDIWKASINISPFGSIGINDCSLHSNTADGDSAVDD